MATSGKALLIPRWRDRDSHGPPELPGQRPTSRLWRDWPCHWLIHRAAPLDLRATAMRNDWLSWGSICDEDRVSPVTRENVLRGSGRRFRISRAIRGARGDPLMIRNRPTEQNKPPCRTACSGGYPNTPEVPLGSGAYPLGMGWPISSRILRRS